jgi:tetratricopeptide (TPR) repeat protein
MDAEDAYLFRHAVVRDAAYDLQLPSERAVLHGLALDVLEAVPSLNSPANGLELARHARLAQEGGRVGRYARAERHHLREGGDFARFNYDYRGALEAFERLHGLIDEPSERAVVADMLADVLQRLGRYADSLPCFEEVRARAENPELVGRALVHLAWIGMESGKQVDALVREGERIAEEVDSHRLRIAFMMMSAHRKAFEGDNTGAAREMQAIIDYAERTDDVAQQLVAHGNAAQYYTQAGDLEAASVHLDAAEKLCQASQMRHHLASVLKARAQAAIRLQHFETAIEFSRQAADIGAETGGRGLLASALCEQAIAQTGLQLYPEAFETLQEVRFLIAETADVTLAISWMKAYAGLMRAWGKKEQAVPVYREGLRELQNRLPAQMLRELQAELEELQGG